MINRKVVVSARAIAALLPFKSKDECRYYLNGIHVEPALPQFGGVILVATDGHKMAIVHDILGEADAAHILDIPRSLARMLGRKASQTALSARAHFLRAAVHLVDTEFPDTADASEPSPHHLYTGYAPGIDGTFPDWRRAVIPGAEVKHTGCAIVINAAYFADFLRAAQCLSEDRRAPPILRIYAPTADGPALITSAHAEDGLSFAGYLMPHRDTLAGDGKTAPAWLAATPADNPKAA